MVAVFTCTFQSFFVAYDLYFVEYMLPGAYEGKELLYLHVHVPYPRERGPTTECQPTPTPPPPPPPPPLWAQFPAKVLD